MANVNISSWTTGQVAEWLRGLGGAVDGYIAMLETRGLNGVRLLAMRCDDLEALGVQIIGHQELLLEAIEHLRNFVNMGLNKPTCCKKRNLRVAGARTLARPEQYQYEPHNLRSETLRAAQRECSAAITEVVSSCPFLYNELSLTPRMV
ncbi:hypothetical protein EVAR_89711_1 [Eumeta japonica]|uniref:SAM domain-containing protein n=1 Tax=Eumeta variegata TaxID=151549 RepID=A0A4C1SKN5_EUMVA|nr:hypothetical protein EVAR_89711_1 [Eumeta japonica]